MKITIKIPAPKEKSFTVKGSSIPEVFNALEKHGFWGRYRSNETIAYETDKKDKNLYIGGSVSGAPVVTLPKWANYGKASKPEKKSWDDMMKALTKHEYNHHTKFEDSAKDWKKEMEKGDDLSKKEMTASWDKFVKELQKTQDAYDARTKHGLTEGVELIEP
jgi:predicted secreted Zn-dependent protease